VIEAFISSRLDAVASPALGGVIIGHETGRALGTRAVFAERVDGTLVFRRGFEIAAGEKVVVIEDVVTTGTSSLETIAALKALGAEVVGLGCIVDRSGGAEVGVPFRSLLQLPAPAFAEADCPACRRGDTPPYKPGSRALGKS
jgi:orotate phosphoribosyltransferase